MLYVNYITVRLVEKRKYINISPFWGEGTISRLELTKSNNMINLITKNFKLCMAKNINKIKRKTTHTIHITKF